MGIWIVRTVRKVTATALDVFGIQGLIKEQHNNNKNNNMLN